MLYSNEEFENFYVRYKVEEVLQNISIKDFCIRNKVTWELFDKWYRDTHPKRVPTQVKSEAELQKEKLIDYLFMRYEKLTAELSAAQEELRLLREQSTEHNREQQDS